MGAKMSCLKAQGEKAKEKAVDTADDAKDTTAEATKAVETAVDTTAKTVQEVSWYDAICFYSIHTNLDFAILGSWRS